MNRWPELPVELEEHYMTDDELYELWHSLCSELLDERFVGRSHHNRRTYDAGCDGPLCRKSVREYGRRRQKNSGPSERFKFVEPILDFWWPIADAKIKAAKVEILKDLTGTELGEPA